MGANQKIVRSIAAVHKLQRKKQAGQKTTLEELKPIAITDEQKKIIDDAIAKRDKKNNISEPKVLQTASKPKATLMSEEPKVIAPTQSEVSQSSATNVAPVSNLNKLEKRKERRGRSQTKFGGLLSGSSSYSLGIKSLLGR